MDQSSKGIETSSPESSDPVITRTRSITITPTLPLPGSWGTHYGDWGDTSIGPYGYDGKTNKITGIEVSDSSNENSMVSLDYIRLQIDNVWQPPIGSPITGKTKQLILAQDGSEWIKTIDIGWHFGYYRRIKFTTNLGNSIDSGHTGFDLNQFNVDSSVPNTVNSHQLIDIQANYDSQSRQIRSTQFKWQPYTGMWGRDDGGDPYNHCDPFGNYGTDGTTNKITGIEIPDNGQNDGEIFDYIRIKINEEWQEAIGKARQGKYQRLEFDGDSEYITRIDAVWFGGIYRKIKFVTNLGRSIESGYESQLIISQYGTNDIDSNIPITSNSNNKPHRLVDIKGRIHLEEHWSIKDYWFSQFNTIQFKWI